MKRTNINKGLVKIMVIGCTLVFIIIVGFSYKNKEQSNENNQVDIENKNYVVVNEDSVENKEKKNNNEDVEVSKETLELNQKKKEILVVNKENAVRKEYIPEDLVVVNVPGIREIELTKEVAEKVEELFRDSKNEGIDLSAISGYRTYEYQEGLHNDNVQASGEEYASKYVAMPGKSEHQTGLAIDVLTEGNASLTEEFEDTQEFKWLNENMHKYGFILRYPKGKEHITGYSYEPWHLRYVGIELATDIRNKGLTLEEYISK